MASRISATGALSVALLMAFSTATATAQEAAPPVATELGSITVIAPRITYKFQRDGAAATMVEVTERSAVVDFTDLDLTRTADLYQLETRIGEAAARVCRELETQYPNGSPSADVCTRRATDDAMAQMQQTARQRNQ